LVLLIGLNQEDPAEQVILPLDFSLRKNITPSRLDAKVYQDDSGVSSNIQYQSCPIKCF
jgi:hypothetical protein